ncbi:MAG TPA: hypothetical protein VFF77_03115, partial [Holophagaceae bacterium]|nr:hypothetical protein [Holophagaceae bacterium]
EIAEGCADENQPCLILYHLDAVHLPSQIFGQQDSPIPGMPEEDKPLYAFGHSEILSRLPHRHCHIMGFD